jgi:hypothetical protein
MVQAMRSYPVSFRRQLETPIFDELNTAGKSGKLRHAPHRSILRMHMSALVDHERYCSLMHGGCSG